MSFEGISPYLHYEDAAAALEWLSRVFGFEEKARFVDQDGVVRQAEMRVGDVELWFSGHGPGYWEEREAPQDYILVWVDDVDAMYERIRCEGGVVEPPVDENYDVRNIRVTDPEGYTWSFLRRLGRGYEQTKSLEDGGLEEVLPA